MPVRGVYVRGDHMRLKSCVSRSSLLAAWPWLLYPLVASTILSMHSPCTSEHHYLPRMVVEAIVSRRSSAKKGSSAKRQQSRWCSSPVWIPFYHILVVLLMTCIATNPFPNHITMFVAHAAVAAGPDMDVGALDRRVDAARRLFEGSDPTTGEAELRGMAERYPSYAQAPFYLGLLSQTRGDPEAAMNFYAATLRADETHADAMNNIGTVLSSLPPANRTRMAEALGFVRQTPAALKTLPREGNTGGSTDVNIQAVDSVVEAFFRGAIEVEGSHRWALNNLGLHLHRRSRNEEAAVVFRRALGLHPRDAEIHYNMGVTLQTLGMVQEAAQSFTNALAINPQHVGGSLNLAALYHRYGDTSMAIELYRKAAEVIDPSDTDMMVMLRNNVGTALYQLGEHTLAKVEHEAVLALLEARRQNLPRLQDDDEHWNVYLDTLVDLHRARKASCDWGGWESHLSNLQSQVEVKQLRVGRPPSLLPFDTLLLPYPVSPTWRRRIAEAWSTKYTDTSPATTGPNHRTDDGKRSGGRDTHPQVGVEEHRAEHDTHQQIDGAARTARTEDSASIASAATTGGPNHPINDDDEHCEGYDTHQQDIDATRTGNGASVAQDGGGGERTKTKCSRRRDANTGIGVAQSRRELNIGFIGHDFSEHPTAHMMEGVFVWHKRLAEDSGGEGGSEGAQETGRGDVSRKSRANGGSGYRASTDCCRYSIYSYGGGGGHGDDDNDNDDEKKSDSDGENSNSTSSRTRQSLRSHASSFVDLYPVGHGESAARIRADGVDILVDLQGHTLGGRSEIAAARPARLQVSYLVFPGTSGASYMDYLIADRHVTPPEHASHYSESLVLLPRTYQANLYEGLGSATTEAVLSPGEKDYEKAVLRRAHGLPGDLSRPVFANFNKIDKLDPESFTLWMQVLRRVPGSVLWLMEPSAVDTEKEAIRKRLGEEAQSQGVDECRIVWARRLPKREHLLRHAAADLFLDTLTYGAHSTATDALAGGLPFLTLAGGSFASRVGVSLLRNAGPKQGALLVAGQREYEDLAVKLVSTLAGRALLSKLRVSLTRKRKRQNNYFNSSPMETGDSAVGADGGVGTEAEVDASELLPLFDTQAVTRDLNRAFMVMSDVDDLWRDSGSGAARAQRGGTRVLPHIVLTRKKLTDEGWGRLSRRDRQ